MAAARTRALHLLGEIVGRETTAVHDPAHQGNNHHLLADLMQAQGELDFPAQTPFAAGLRATVDWYSCTLDTEHPNKELDDDTT